MASGSDILGDGWNLSPEGLNLITNDGALKEKSKVLRNALDSDLKEIGSPLLAKEITKGSISRAVLQIQKIRNISAPKANERSQTAPRMLKINLTDGDAHVQAIEISPLSSISQEKTPPGSKVLITSAPIASGYILLNAKNCALLGGQVPALYDKWELTKSVHLHNRQTSSTSGAPAWASFGCKISAAPTDNQFKSLDNNSKENGKDNSEFELQRQGAIAEATSGAVKKVFGGGTKQSAQIASISGPKRYNENYTKDVSNNREDRRNYKSKNIGNTAREVEEKPAKPSDKVSLFDFLEDKLVANGVAPDLVQKEPDSIDLSYPRNNYNNARSAPNYQKYNNTRPKPDFNKSNFPKFEKNKYKQEQSYNSNYNRHNAANDLAGSLDKMSLNNQFEFNKSNFPKFEKPKSSQLEQNYNNRPNVASDVANNPDKASLSNSQFASRSLRQHLNLGSGPLKKPVETKDAGGSWNWKIGDDCMAKYWEDGKYYNANITALTEKTCVVQFKGYGNIEEILKSDCLPVTNDNPFKKSHNGSMEFRRSAKSYRN